MNGSLGESTPGTRHAISEWEQTGCVLWGCRSVPSWPRARARMVTMLLRRCARKWVSERGACGPVPVLVFCALRVAVWCPATGHAVTAALMAV